MKISKTTCTEMGTRTTYSFEIRNPFPKVASVVVTIVFEGEEIPAWYFWSGVLGKLGRRRFSPREWRLLVSFIRSNEYYQRWVKNGEMEKR